MLAGWKRLVREKGGLAQFIRYLFVGGSSVVVDFAVFELLLHLLGIEDLLLAGAFLVKPEKAANAAAVVIGFLYSFILNRTWAFQSKDNLFRQLGLMILLLAFNTVITSEAVSFLGRELGVAFAVAKLTMQFAVALWNYIIYDKIIYRS
ncbi:MAG: GtrA family protein [Clostridiaceae bacterium]|nr:GtrA family protein [Clostridiaceae bacterium]